MFAALNKVVCNRCNKSSDRNSLFHSFSWCWVLNTWSLLFKILIEASSQVHEKSVCLKEDSIAAPWHNCGNFTSSLNSSQFKEGWRGGEGRSKKFGGFGLTLSLDNRRSLVLDGLLNKVLGSFSLLRRDLLLFNGLGELRSEMQVSDGHIVKNDVEIAKSLSKAVSDLLGDLLSLGQELSGVVAGNNWLEHFIDDGGEHTAVVVLSKETIQGEQLLRVRSEQDSQRDVDHL